MDNGKKDYLRSLGFEAEIDRIDEGRCPFCGADTKQAVFRDDISRRENEISGLCQVCQDRVFGASEVADTEVFHFLKRGKDEQ